MTYKDGITKAMEELGKKKNVVMLGEGLINGGRIYGTLDEVDTKKCIEFPIAENLIMGSAIGLAIQGFRPVVIFQRMDFLMVACDAIINHLCVIPEMSGNRVKLPVIIRTIIGSQKDSFCMGKQHNKDLSYIFKPIINTFILEKGMNIEKYYEIAYESTSPTMIIEKRDLYDKVNV